MLGAHRRRLFRSAYPITGATLWRSLFGRSGKTKRSRPWTSPLAAIAVGSYVGYLHYLRVCEREEQKLGIKKPKTWHPLKVYMYSSIPLRMMSRCWGWMSGLHVPLSLRPYLYGTYAAAFGCDMTEAEFPQFQDYDSFGTFFTRKLNPNARFIDKSASLLCPADGALLRCGSIQDGVIEQVKGITYSVPEFLGSPVSPIGENQKLFYCVVYLAPGDYHGFHSPADWTVTTRRYFYGKLLSVSGYIMQRVPKLFCINERISLLGTWKHGFFSMTAVGATNVGNIRLEKEVELVTNRGRIPVGGGMEERRVKWREGKGERTGEFRMGSSIVLVFQAPTSFRFLVQEGTHVRLGQALGDI